MIYINWLMLISLLGGVLYLVLAFAVLRKRSLHENAPRWLFAYLSFSLLVSLSQVLSALDLPISEWLQQFDSYSLLLLTIFFYFMSRAVLEFTTNSRVWWVLSLAWISLYLLVDTDILALGEVLAVGIGFNVSQPTLALIILSTGWAIYMSSIVVIIARTMQRSTYATQKNRASYWILALMLFVLGSGLIFAGLSAYGYVVLCITAVLSTGVIVLQQLPDFRLVERQVLVFLLMTLLTALVLVIGFLAAPNLLRNGLQYNLALTSAVIALTLAACLILIWVLTQRIANRLFPASQYDSNRILRQYSQSISNVLDPELLATLAIDMINEAVQIQRGYLFLVDHELEEGRASYRLRGVRGRGDDNPAAVSLSVESPIAECLNSENRALRQSEIDLLPRFQTAAQEERDWFAKLKVDVLIPVHSKDEWIGLIALGPKVSGAPYFETDLNLLGIMANQTAVALQNARLVESLMRLNNDFRRAYAAMEHANNHLKKVNQQLEILDRTKSDFINIASHELRTPLTLMRGYSQMLVEDQLIASNTDEVKLVNGIHNGVLRMHEIVNSMLDMASIDTRSLQLQLEPLSLNVVIHMVCDGLSRSLQERRLELSYENLSQLPQIEGDPEALQKAFQHLIQNAIKFTPDGGSITIIGMPVTPGQVQMPDGGVEIILRDTGIGIAPEFQELIFTKFYQTGELALHSTGKTKFKGAGPGLGLAIAKGIIEAHGGRIWAESPGYDEEKLPGSQFHVVLPLHQPA